MKIDVSFITINYNSSEYTISLIESIQKFTSDVSYEIIVVDNNSNDKEYKLLASTLKNTKNTTIIKNKINAGFSAGNMLGVNSAQGEYYFFINNDAKLLNNAAFLMKKYLDSNNDVSLATAKIEDENGKCSSSYKLFPSLTKEIFGNTIARKFSTIEFPSNRVKLIKPTLVQVVSGSCMFFRTSTFNDIGGFDTAFFLYCEEEDLSKRTWDINKKVVFLPDAKVFHESGGSTEQNLSIKKEYYISYKHLIFKHFNTMNAFILFFLLYLKLFRGSFKSKDSCKLFLFALIGFNKKESLRYKQRLKNAT